jgi:anti-sigma regulatory factor (Ser/Thr protein kinase)
MRAVIVRDDSQIADARRQAVAMAAGLGFNASDQGRLAIVATELSTNLIKHGGGGELVLSVMGQGEAPGVQCLALDRGPGIVDVAAAMRDGHSTAGTPGNGLGAVARQSQLFDIYSRRGQGAAVLAQVCIGPPPKPPSGLLQWGVINLAKPGEEACGDGWSVRCDASGFGLMVVDGLGHGPLAATASHVAVRAFEAAQAVTPALVETLHQALRATRGAAASIVHLPHEDGDLSFIGVGNVAGVLISDADARRMVSYNGTLGHALKHVRPFQYPAKGEVLVILASDGLGTNWSLDAYAGLRGRHPALIAGVLYRDFTRGRDDVTVLVARRARA